MTRVGAAGFNRPNKSEKPHANNRKIKNIPLGCPVSVIHFASISRQLAQETCFMRNAKAAFSRRMFIGGAAVAAFIVPTILFGASIENRRIDAASSEPGDRSQSASSRTNHREQFAAFAGVPSTPRADSESSYASGLIGGTVNGAAGPRTSASPESIITVRSNASSGGTCPGATCTLRQAIATAVPGDTINFDMATVTSPLTPDFPELAINKNLTIQGPGAGLLTLRSNSSAGPRLFNIAAGFTLNVSGLTIANFRPNVFAGHGGAIVNAGTLNLTGVVFTGNRTFDGGNGGAIRNSGTLNITDSVFSGNFTTAGGGGTGGAIHNTPSGVLDIDRTTFVNNSGEEEGGAIANDGTLKVTNSSFINNALVATNGFEGGGGAINHYADTTLVITNCTFSGNSVSGTFEPPPNGLPGGGGAIANSHNGIIEITHSTISGNSMTATNGNGGGVANFRFHGTTGTIKIKNSIVAGNTATPSTGADVFGLFVSQGFDFIGRADGSTGFANGVGNDQAGTNAAPINPMLGAVENNGGPTFTMAPQAGSPVIDAGSSFGIATDQRGLSRPVDWPATASGAGDQADIGAFELQNSIATQLAFTVQPSNVFAGGPITPAVQVQVRDAGGGLVNSNASITVSLGNNPGGATLNGTTTVQAVNGVATFSNLSINAVANGYTLVANSAPLTQTISNTFNVTSGPDLAISKTHTGSFQQSQVGAQYIITVTNVGGVATSGVVTVTDTPPAGMTATSISGTGWTCTVAPLTCTRSSVLAPAVSYPPITLTVTVAGNAPSSITNTASVSGGGQFLTGNDTASDPATITTCTAPIVVTNNANTGPGSLRQAIADICWGGTISFGGGVTSPIVLASELSVAKLVTIQGPGANSLAISGNDQVRIFNVTANGNMTVSGLTLTNGRRPFSSQSPDSGGAILNVGVINLNNTVMSNNAASGGSGGALGNSGTATIANSTLSANSSAVGGAINNSPNGILNLTNSTITGNSAQGNITVGQLAVGGGIRNFLATLNITSCTIADNTALDGGGGISTSNATPNLKNTIIAKNSNDLDVSGAFVSQGYNLIGKPNSATGFTNNVNNDQVGTNAAPLNPMLADLANNGGPTQTRALLTGSPAIDKGKSFGSFADQRGLPRPVDDPAIPNASGGDAADIGAFELQNGTQPPSRLSGVVTYGTTAVGQAAKFVPGVLISAAGSTPVSATTDSTGSYLLSGLGSGAYTVTPTKSGDVNGISGLDAARVAQHVAGLIVLTPNQQIAGDATNNGSLSGLDAARIAQTVAGISNTGITGQWKFLPASRSYPSVTTALTNENYEAILVGDVTGNWTSGVPRADRETEDRESDRGDADGELIVPVSIGDTTGKGIVAYDFTVVFDPDVVRPANSPVDVAGALSDGWSVVHNVQTPGRMRVIAFSTGELTGKGVLLRLRFHVLAGGEAARLRWADLQLNEHEVPCTLSDGAQADLDANPTGPDSPALHIILDDVSPDRSRVGDSSNNGSVCAKSG
jgi:hypothetical protein